MSKTVKGSPIGGNPRVTYVSELTFLAVIDVGNSDLTLRNVVVVIDVIGQHTIGCGISNRTG